MKYRSEIDGLRAVAVLPVIFFHAGFSFFEGGFVGVDIFFVISGYLITTIIIEELKTDSFSILNFYERRARRILPALCFVMISCIPFAWIWMIPSQFKEFAQSLVAVSLFSSNILFWIQDGYFASASEIKPLLHTWSLAVEEQYYLFFPILMIFLWSFGRRRVFWSIVAVAVMSFALSEAALRLDPSANFYLIPFRAWELLAGSLCAFLREGRDWKGRDGLASAGLGLILVAIFGYDAATPFPGAYALAPVMGTVLVIMFAGRGGRVARLLSAPPLVGIGLISYSAYLWHQPLFAFARLRSFGEPDVAVLLVLSTASLVLAYFSWRFVEQPFRRRSAFPLPTRRAVFAASAAACAGLIGFGLTIHLQNGWPDRISAADVSFAELDEKVRVNYGLDPDCDRGFTTSGDCRTDDRPEILVWGDSFAMHLVPAFLADDPDVALQQHTMSMCAPILGLSLTRASYPAERARECIVFNDAVYEWLEQAPSVRHVVLSSPFGLIHNDVFTRDGEVEPAPVRLDFVAQALIDTVRRIKALGPSVTVVAPTPGDGRDIGRCLVRVRMFDLPDDNCDFSLDDLTGKIKRSYRLMDIIAREAPVMRMEKLICPDRRCRAMQDGVFIYRDARHLSVEGAAYLALKRAFVDRMLRPGEVPIR